MVNQASNSGFQPYGEAGGGSRLGVGMIIESVGSLISGAEMLTSSRRDASGLEISVQDKKKVDDMVNFFTSALVRVQKAMATDLAPGDTESYVAESGSLALGVERLGD